MKYTVTLMLCLGCLIFAPAMAESNDDQPRLSSATLSGFKLRSIGPAFMSGRIADVAIDSENENTWYVAVGSGNLWKTVNAGTTWQPIFENYGSYSIGCVTIDPGDQQTIWVGSGEAVGGRHVGYGDGVYVSRDGGASFKNMGLKESEHIAKIIVDPRDADVVYVAAQGPLWSPNGQRGLFRSSDGGQTWKPILSKGPYTGATDIAMDPDDPDTIYAALHQRHRTVWSLVNGGPESGIYKSTDGGDSWRELTAGLPAEDKGKIGLAVSPLKPNVVYATIELAGRTGGFWRSENRGETWSKMSDYVSGGTGPHYYQEIWCDPHRFDVVYQANVQLGRTDDGGKTWESVGNSAKHVDNHAVAFKQSDPDFVLVGCDGGLYCSYDYADTYRFVSNLPVTQFYKLDLDNDFPIYHVVGGTQDNNTQYGPTRTNNNTGIRNSDWRITIGGDGHDCAIDPEDPNIIYCESQQGYLRRFDRRTGESVDIRPQPEKGEEAFRFNWDSPILISPHDHRRLYFGSRRLHRSDDRGDSWKSISPDLSRNVSRYEKKVMDRVWSLDAVYDIYAMSQYGNITSISESPVKEGLIYVGTDDGLIQVTENGGETWRRIERVYGIPEESFVNDIKADRFDENTVYAVFDNHKQGDLKPYIVKSTDRGQNWQPLVGDLPERHIVWRIIQDHVQPNLLFAGTEFGLFCTLDGGEKWLKLSGGVPNIPFRDLEIQRRENDIVGATFGRSFYVLDDYSPLRAITEEMLTENDFVLFPIKQALRYVQQRPIGGGKGSMGDALYVAENPPFGAVFTYYLKETLKSRKAQRMENEKQAKASGGDTPLPTWEELKKEEREEPPKITFTIRDSAGNVMNHVSGETSAGIHRVAWNLRYAGFSADEGRGPLVPPGSYSVSCTKRVDEVETPLGEPQTVEVVALGDSSLPAQDPQEIFDFQKEVGELTRILSGTSKKTREVLTQMKEIRAAIQNSPEADSELASVARQLELKLKDAYEALSGDETKEKRFVVQPPSIMDRIQNVAFGTMFSTYGPTTTQRRNLELARAEYQDLEGHLTGLIEQDYQQLLKRLDEANVPWTTGRPLPQLKP